MWALEDKDVTHRVSAEHCDPSSRARWLRKSFEPHVSADEDKVRGKKACEKAPSFELQS